MYVYIYIYIYIIISKYIYIYIYIYTYPARRRGGDWAGWHTGSARLEEEEEAEAWGLAY